MNDDTEFDAIALRIAHEEKLVSEGQGYVPNHWIKFARHIRDELAKGAQPKCDHAAAMEIAAEVTSQPFSADVDNLAACYLDLTERHIKLLELAGALSDIGNENAGEIVSAREADDLIARYDTADAALRAFIEEERNTNQGETK